MAEHRLERTAFTTSRLLEFSSEKELVSQTGHSAEEWPFVILKELADNGLDATEEHGVAPVISISVDTERRQIVITDNGPGIPPETVASILDYSKRTSSHCYRSARDRAPHYVRRRSNPPGTSPYA